MKKNPLEELKRILGDAYKPRMNHRELAEALIWLVREATPTYEAELLDNPLRGFDEEPYWPVRELATKQGRRRLDAMLDMLFIEHGELDEAALEAVCEEQQLVILRSHTDGRLALVTEARLVVEQRGDVLKIERLIELLRPSSTPSYPVLTCFEPDDRPFVETPVELADCVSRFTPAEQLLDHFEAELADIDSKLAELDAGACDLDEEEDPSTGPISNAGMGLAVDSELIAALQADLQTEGKKNGEADSTALLMCRCGAAKMLHGVDGFSYQEIGLSNGWSMTPAGWFCPVCVLKSEPKRRPDRRSKSDGGRGECLGPHAECDICGIWFERRSDEDVEAAKRGFGWHTMNTSDAVVDVCCDCAKRALRAVPSAKIEPCQ